MGATRPSRARRIVGIAIGVAVILALGFYGPATLVGPLPEATAQTLPGPQIATSAIPPTLPTDGASGVTLDSTHPPVASAGIADPVPMGGAAKIVTALVVLAKHPMEAGRQGESVTVTAEDYADLLRYASSSARVVPFVEGEVWTEREMLQAMLLGSSNNHADTLARWSFGSMDAYLSAASAWLAQQGLKDTTVVDATGLDEGSQSTGTDAARLTALAFANPAVAEIMAQDSATVNGRRIVTNVAAYRASDGVSMLSRSFTDQAGLCVMFAATVPTSSGSARIYAAFLREPDYDTLNADLTAFLSSASAGITQTAVITAGTPYARYTTAWGDSVNAVAASTESRLLWGAVDPALTVEAAPQNVVAKGAEVGRVSAALPDGDVTVILRTDGRLNDPGPLWRVTHPIPVIQALVASLAAGR